MLNSLNLLIHEKQEFKHCTVYMSGHAFYDCSFFRCTLVVRDWGILTLVGCKFDCCLWHLDLLISDPRAWENMTRVLVPLIQGSLPRPFLPTDGNPDTPAAPS